MSTAASMIGDILVHVSRGNREIVRSKLNKIEPGALAVLHAIAVKPPAGNVMAAEAALFKKISETPVAAPA